MQVITLFGLGEVSLWPEQGKTVDVEVHTARLGQKLMRLNKEQVFLFSNWAILQVINLQGQSDSKLISKLQFHDFYSRSVGLWAEARKFCVQNETTFLLDIEHGKFELNRPFDLLGGNFLHVRPWMHIWGPEKTTPHPDIDTALKAFLEEKESLATSSGINANILLDMKNERIISFFIAVTPGPQGSVVFEKNFS